MDIELVDYIGQIRNNTTTLGKGYIFNITLDDYSFDVMLFMHIDICFVTLHPNDELKGIDKGSIYEAIIEKYGKDKLI